MQRHWVRFASHTSTLEYLHLSRPSITSGATRLQKRHTISCCQANSCGRGRAHWSGTAYLVPKSTKARRVAQHLLLNDERLDTFIALIQQLLSQTLGENGHAAKKIKAVHHEAKYCASFYRFASHHCYLRGGLSSKIKPCTFGNTSMELAWGSASYYAKANSARAARQAS